MLFAHNVRPETRDPQLKVAERDMVPVVLPNSGGTPPFSSSGSAGNSSGPFIGVSSEDKTDAVLFYYGIDRHDAWIFTPFLR
jgi:hypothetical protein